MPNIFQTTDKSGRKIQLSKERWKHINQEHPEVSEYLEEIKGTLKNPIKSQKPPIRDWWHVIITYYASGF